LHQDKYGQDGCNVGDEGSFAPIVQGNNEALDVFMDAIKKSDHEGKVQIGTNVAASKFWLSDVSKDDFDFENAAGSSPTMQKTADQMIDYCKDWLAKYPLVSIEDPYVQDDCDADSRFQGAVGNNMQIVGHDLLVTRPKRLKKGLDCPRLDS